MNTPANPLFIIPIIVGIIFLIAGFLLFKFPPKKINGLYGYRTYRSMKNQENWDFAQICAGKEMLKMGLFLGMCSGLTFFFDTKEITNIFLALSLVIVTTIVLFIRVERKLKSMH